MKENEVIRQSASYRILELLYSSLRGSFSYHAVRSAGLHLVSPVKKAFEFSGFRRLIHCALAAGKSNFYSIAQLTLFTVLICDLVIGRMICGIRSCGNMVILISAISAMGLARAGAFDRILSAMLNSTTFRLLRIKI